MVAQGWDMRGVIFISWVKKDAESAPLGGDGGASAPAQIPQNRDDPGSGFSDAALFRGNDGCLLIATFFSFCLWVPLRCPKQEPHCKAGVVFHSVQPLPSIPNFFPPARLLVLSTHDVLMR